MVSLVLPPTPTISNPAKHALDIQLQELKVLMGTNLKPGDSFYHSLFPLRFRVLKIKSQRLICLFF